MNIAADRTFEIAAYRITSRAPPDQSTAGVLLLPHVYGVDGSAAISPTNSPAAG